MNVSHAWCIDFIMQPHLYESLFFFSLFHLVYCFNTNKSRVLVRCIFNLYFKLEVNNEEQAYNLILFKRIKHVMNVITVINYEYNETKSEFKLLILFLKSTFRFNCLLNRTGSVQKPFF